MVPIGFNDDGKTEVTSTILSKIQLFLNYSQVTISSHHHWCTIQLLCVRIAGKNYYSRKHMDALFGVTAEIEALTEWLTTEEAETLYSTTKESLRTQAYRRHIPTKREYGKTYYSKKHLDDIFRPDLKASDAYCTTADAAEKYGMTKSNICVIIKKEKITKIKVGVQNLIVKEELEKVMAERLAQFGSYRVQ